MLSMRILSRFKKTDTIFCCRRPEILVGEHAVVGSARTFRDIKTMIAWAAQKPSPLNRSHLPRRKWHHGSYAAHSSLDDLRVRDQGGQFVASPCFWPLVKGQSGSVRSCVASPGSCPIACQAYEVQIVLVCKARTGGLRADEWYPLSRLKVEVEGQSQDSTI